MSRGIRGGAESSRSSRGPRPAERPEPHRNTQRHLHARRAQQRAVQVPQPDRRPHQRQRIDGHLQQSGAGVQLLQLRAGGAARPDHRLRSALLYAGRDYGRSRRRKLVRRPDRRGVSRNRSGRQPRAVLRSADTPAQAQQHHHLHEQLLRTQTARSQPLPGRQERNVERRRAGRGSGGHGRQDRQAERRRPYRHAQQVLQHQTRKRHGIRVQHLLVFREGGLRQRVQKLRRRPRPHAAGHQAPPAFGQRRRHPQQSGTERPDRHGVQGRPQSTW